MPGKVVKVLVKLGEEVKEGQGLVVVEAMKMENELKSPKAGKVVELPAQGRHRRREQRQAGGGRVAEAAGLMLAAHAPEQELQVRFR